MIDRAALVVDDAPANRDFLERLLTGAKFRVIGAGSGSQALAAVTDMQDLALAVVDMKLPDMTGLQLVAELRQRFPKACLIIATMLDERHMMEAAFQHGCNVFLVKPHGFMELFQRLIKSDVSDMRDGPYLVIDQYGPRVFKLSTNEMRQLEKAAKNPAPTPAVETKPANDPTPAQPIQEPTAPVEKAANIATPVVEAKPVSDSTPAAEKPVSEPALERSVSKPTPSPKDSI
ncbi:MAG TPA: response regulator [Phototrophicaceae bacterium]|nr:response regulator [Phototrophicaceae bacterium]